MVFLLLVIWSLCGVLEGGKVREGKYSEGKCK